MQLFARLAKVNEETREVEGVLAVEQPDRGGEIFDYATSKPYFESWSNEVQKASGGKSVGNVRAMHGKVAAGKLTSIDFNDNDKQIAVVAKIIDDNEWTKVLEGVYTGFSIGGSYVRRWADPVQKSLRRYTGRPIEATLADIPEMPGATFTLVRKTGEPEMRKFTSVRQPSQFWDCGRECGTKHVQKAHAIACDGTGIEKTAAVDREELLEKCLGCVASIAYTIQSVTTERPSRTTTFSDGSSYTDLGHEEMEAGVKQLFDALRAMVNDLRDKWLTDEGIDPTLAMAALADELKKTDTVMKSLRVQPGTVQPGNGSIENKEIPMKEEEKPKAPETAATANEPTELQKVASSIDGLSKKFDDLAKTAGDVVELKKTVGELSDLVETLAKAVGNLPVQPKGQVRPVPKQKDGDDADLKKTAGEGKTGNPFIDDVQRIF
jgi:hypothetical protein